MKSRWRGLVVVALALSIAGLLIVEDLGDRRAIDELNRSQSGEKMTYDGGWISGAARWLALGITVIEGRALVVAVRRGRAGSDRAR